MHGGNPKKSGKWNRRRGEFQTNISQEGDVHSVSRHESVSGQNEFSPVLTLSSLLFIVPAAIALRGRCFSLAFLYFLTTVVSANHGREACSGWNRDLGLLVSKASYVATVATGLRYVRNPALLTPGCWLAALIPILCLASNRLHNARSPLWVAPHAAMHLAVSVGMSIAAAGAIVEPQ